MQIATQLGKAIPGDNSSTYEMCYLDEENYEVANNVLTGQYTYNGDVTEIFYDIVITFDYNASTDQVSFSCEGEGILDGKSFSFYPNPDFN
ncbi:hypothetical protein [Sphaerochaeta halotolerans]|nr:hypothetical protein [Sphaerochaeta halotolerans]